MGGGRRPPDPVVRVLVQHDRQHRLPIGKAVRLAEGARGLECQLRISKTRDGDEVLELVRDGALRHLSIGFRPIKA